MATRIVRFRVCNGQPKPLEPVELVEGSEFEANVEVVETSPAKPKPKLVLPTWDLGVMEPLTREQIYEDVC